MFIVIILSTTPIQSQQIKPFALIDDLPKIEMISDDVLKFCADPFKEDPPSYAECCGALFPVTFVEPNHLFVFNTVKRRRDRTPFGFP